jgi:hypothetical protein
MYIEMSFDGFSRFQEQQLGDDQRGHVVLDLAGDEDDAFAQQARKMSKLRSPRLDCSTTTGISAPVTGSRRELSLGAVANRTGRSWNPLVTGRAYVGAAAAMFKGINRLRANRLSRGPHKPCAPVV